MNALEFVFTPHNFLPSNFPLPFTVPATSTLIATAVSDAVEVTTPRASIPTESLLAAASGTPSSLYNSSTPMGFLFYLASQSQRIFASNSTNSILFGGPSRRYWLLTLFMYALVNRTMTYASVRRPIRLKPTQRLLLRLAPILLLLHCTMRILSCIRCQSPDSYPLSWPHPCLAAPQHVLWYTFKCTCFSYFIDTFCANLEMRNGLGDNGMTIIEYALAFAETANVTPAPEVLIAALLSVGGTLVTSHLVSLFNLYSYQLIPTMLHGIITLTYFIYTIVSGRFVHLSSIFLLFQIPYILTLILLCMCTCISLLATILIGRRDLRTSIWDGGVGVPGLNEDFYAWLFKWGVIALTSVQEATFLTENEALRMPRTTILEHSDDQDLEEEAAIRNGIGFRREWIRTGTVPKSRNSGPMSRTQNFRSALYFLQATFRTYLTLALRYLNGEDVHQRGIRQNMPYSAGALTPYNEDDDPDYIFSDRDTSPSESGDEESCDESVRETTPGPPPLRTQKIGGGRRLVRGQSPFEMETRGSGSPLEECSGPPLSRRERERTPFDKLEPNPPSSYNANPPSPASSFLDGEDSDDSLTNPMTELFPDFAGAISTLLIPSSQAESEHSQLLISHLSSQRILTRSRYRDKTESQRLESFIRAQRPPSSNDTDNHQYVAEVQKCAVCRTNPRVIVNWPCRYASLESRLTKRCLALCDDCRQTLAVRNFSGCPCCRRKVASYSRIYIP